MKKPPPPAPQSFAPYAPDAIIASKMLSIDSLVIDVEKRRLMRQELVEHAADIV